jgi:hypothetical protein
VSNLLSLTDNQYVVSTHSPTLLDLAEGTLVRVDGGPGKQTTAHVVSRPKDRADLARDLGLRPSDLVLANSVLWIEGPSDRLYIRHWLHLTDPELIEGAHFTFVMYGGQLARHLTAAEDRDRGVEDLVEILRINRNSVVVMDSDLRSSGEALQSHKERLCHELSERGLCWITQGYTLENYLEPETFRRVYAEVHPLGARTLTWNGEPHQDPFWEGVQSPDKVEIARRIAATEGTVPGVLDLQERLREVATFVRRANDMSPLPPDG